MVYIAFMSMLKDAYISRTASILVTRIDVDRRCSRNSLVGLERPHYIFANQFYCKDHFWMVVHLQKPNENDRCIVSELEHFSNRK